MQDEFGRIVPRIRIPKIHLPKFIKTLGHIAFAPFIYLALKPLAFVGAQAMKVLSKLIGHSMGKVTNRRAHHIAWQRRRSKTPTKAEMNESAAWAHKYAKSQGVVGKIAAKLHKAPKARIRGDMVGVAPAVIIAMIPTVLALLKIFENMAAKQGAPVNPSQPPPESPQASIPEPPAQTEAPPEPTQAPALEAAPTAEASGYPFKSQNYFDGLAILTRGTSAISGS